MKKFVLLISIFFLGCGSLQRSFDLSRDLTKDDMAYIQKLPRDESNSRYVVNGLTVNPNAFKVYPFIPLWFGMQGVGDAGPGYTAAKANSIILLYLYKGAGWNRVTGKRELEIGAFSIFCLYGTEWGYDLRTYKKIRSGHSILPLPLIGPFFSWGSNPKGNVYQIFFFRWGSGT